MFTIAHNKRVVLHDETGGIDYTVAPIMQDGELTDVLCVGAEDWRTGEILDCPGQYSDECWNMLTRDSWEFERVQRIGNA